MNFLHAKNLKPNGLPIIISKLNLLLVFMLVFSFANQANSQINVSTAYNIDIRDAKTNIHAEHLKLGGTNLNDDKISVNNYYISINDKPIIPITGEFHFSRYPNKYWDESIKKMKAGGINMIATYVFWNIHEETEGKFNWSGDRDLHKFIELCKQNNIYAIIRIGPFCHGEIRNGGIPDWMLGKPFSIRSNNPGYLFYVERFYGEIAKQLKGQFFKDGGPILGVQIENEYQHSASPWGLTYPGQPYDWTASERDLALTQQGVGISEKLNPYAELGNDHMKVLKSIAIKEGIEAPLYTATGWGNAAIIPNESLPVSAAYAYPTWTTKKDISPFFIYKDLHKNPDYSPVRYTPEDYPVFAAELGSGIMSTYSRRPIVPAESMDALINRCIGSGANGIGYYMFHGGSTPKGEHYFSDEAYAYPKISYDFQAPIGEYGQIRPSFHRLKLLHFFLNDFSDLLAPMVTVLPENNIEIKPNNINSLRFAVRVKDGSGFLFINNFQDDTIMTDKKDIQIKMKTSTGEILIPERKRFSLKNEENAIFPFNFNLNGAILNYATAQLLMKGDDPVNPFYVFFVLAGNTAEFSFVKNNSIAVKNISQCKIEKTANRIFVECPENGISEFTVSSKNGPHTNILVIEKKLALKSWIAMIQGKKHLILSDVLVLQNNESFEMYDQTEKGYDFFVYPRLKSLAQINSGTITSDNKSSILSHFIVTHPEINLLLKTKRIDEKRIIVPIPSEKSKDINDIFVTIDYLGDTGMGFNNGNLVTDEFYKGIPWQIGLKRFMDRPEAKEMNLYFRPIYKDAPFLVDLNPKIIASINIFPKVKINKIDYTIEYKSIITFSK